MASTALLGFLKGASAQGLDSLNARKAAEAEERKQKLLAQLRVDTEKEMAIFAEDLPSAKAKRELDANKDRREEEKLGLDRDKFAIDSELARSGDARADRLANAQIGAYNRSGSGGGRGGRGSLDSEGVSAPDEFTVANELLDKFKAAIPTDVPTDVVHELALGAVRTALRSGGTQQQMIQNAQDRLLFQLKNLKQDIVQGNDEYDQKGPLYIPANQLRQKAAEYTYPKK